MKKTLKWLEKSPLEFRQYLSSPCEIDEDLYNEIAWVVPPVYSYEWLVQWWDAEYTKHDVLFYSTVSYIDGKYYYLWILPEFKQEDHNDPCKNCWSYQ